MSDTTKQAANGEPESLSDVVPFPPRYKWLKRFAKAGVILIICVIILRIGWGMIARQRLDALIDSYRAAGQLVTAAEFDAALDAVPDDENAAVLYEEAMESYMGTTASGVLLSTFMDDVSNIETNPSVADEFMQGNSEALAIIRRATERPRVAWSHRLKDPIGNPGLYGTQRMIARVLYFASAYQMARGNDAGAMATVYDLVSFNDAVGAHPSLISNLVSWACHGLCDSFVERFGERVRISQADARINQHIAQRDQIDRLIELLLDEQGCRESARLGRYGDRAFSLSMMETMERYQWEAIKRRGVFSEEGLTCIVESMTHPIYVLDTLRILKYNTMAANAISERSWVAASRHFSAASQRETVLRVMVRPMSYVYGYGLQQNTIQKMSGLFFRHIARRRMAALALAIRVYEVEHGTRPTKLDAIVPKYLTTLPLDPFAPNGATFIYKPLAARPLLYSVGQNGSDDDGRMVRNASGARADIPFYLAPELPEEADDESESSLETGDDGEQVEQQ